jgi:hypothetical protein
VHDSVTKPFEPRLSAYAPLVRSSWDTTRRNEHSTGLPETACLRRHRPWQGRDFKQLDCPPANVNTRSSARINRELVNECVYKSTFVQIFGAHPGRIHQDSASPAICALAQGCNQTPPTRPCHACSGEFARTPLVGEWSQHGLETDLITFSRLHAVEPAARACHESLNKFYQILVAKGGIGPDAFNLPATPT